MKATRYTDLDGVCAYLADTPRHIRRLVHERRIPHYKLGHKLRFDLTEIDDWLATSRREVVA